VIVCTAMSVETLMSVRVGNSEVIWKQ
jgi:hypothetical protein